MCFRAIKWSIILSVSLMFLGILVLGRSFWGHVHTATRSARQAVQDNIPIEMELARARNMIDAIVPELRSNIQVIANEEVEVEHLRNEIERIAARHQRQAANLAGMREQLSSDQVIFVVAGRQVVRKELTDKLARELQKYKNSQAILASKQTLLERRQQSLHAAMALLDKTRARKAELEQQVELLATQHRLLKAESVGSSMSIDGSQATQADQLIAQIQKRLDTAQKVIEHEREFFAEETEIPVETVADEQALLAEVEFCLGPQTKLASSAAVGSNHANDNE